MKDYYQILESNRTATAEEIKKAYRRLVLLYHPDKNQEPQAVAIFRDVQEAYEILGDSAKRTLYDQGLLQPIQAYSGYTSQPAPEDPREVYKREYLRKQREERRMAEERMVRVLAKLYACLKVSSTITLAFGLMVCIDRILPSKPFLEPVEDTYSYLGKSYRKVSGVAYGGFRYVDTRNFSFAIDEDFWEQYIAGDSLIVVATPLLKIVKSITLENQKTSLTVEPRFSIYDFGMVLPLALVVISAIPLRWKTVSMQRIYCGLVAVILAVVLFVIK